MLSAANLQENLNDLRSLIRLMVDPAMPWNTSPATNLQAISVALADAISDITAGIGLLGGGTGPSVTLDVDVGTGPGQIVQLDGLGRLPAVDASLLTNVPGAGVPTTFDLFLPTASQTVFALSQTGIQAGSNVFVNGVRYHPGLHYTIVGATLTWLPIPTEFNLGTTDLLVVNYEGS
jgi:hypothetical protein